MKVYWISHIEENLGKCFESFVKELIFIDCGQFNCCFPANLISFVKESLKITDRALHFEMYRIILINDVFPLSLCYVHFSTKHVRERKISQLVKNKEKSTKYLTNKPLYLIGEAQHQ